MSPPAPAQPTAPAPAPTPAPDPPPSRPRPHQRRLSRTRPHQPQHPRPTRLAASVGQQRKATHSLANQPHRPLRNRSTQHSFSQLTLVISGPLGKRSPRPRQPPTRQDRPPRRLGRLPAKPFHKIAPSSSPVGRGQRDLAAKPLSRSGRGAQPSR